MAAKRKSIDCRDYPSEKNCSLKISGTEEEVVDAAVQHAVSAHGHEETLSAQRRQQINVALMPVSAFHSAHLHLGFGFQLGEQLL